MFKSRYGIILVYFLLSMVCFTLMRAVFYVSSWNVIDHSLLNTLSVFGVGLVRDAFVNNYEKEICSNGHYQFVGAFRNNMLDYKPFYASGPDLQISERAKKLVGKDPATGELYDISRNIRAEREEKRLNVFIICVESLSAEFLSHFGQKKNLTPFMDQWFKEGLFFTRFYATGTRTIRALEAITLSIPPTAGRSLVKRPDNGNMQNLGKIFKDRGYDIAFLYGGRGYFDNMNAFYSGNGFRVVDLYDFEDGEVVFQNAWGVSDGDLYRKAVKEANRACEDGKPFFYFLMTTSNHRSYTYPEGKIDIPSGTGGRNGAVKYTDYALGELLSLARKQKWFDDTVFVLVSDHCASSNGEVGLPLNKYHIPPVPLFSQAYPAKGGFEDFKSDRYWTYPPFASGIYLQKLFLGGTISSMNDSMRGL